MWVLKSQYPNEFTDHDCLLDTLKGAIRVAIDYDRNNAYLHVEDTGVGIPESGNAAVTFFFPFR